MALVRCPKHSIPYNDANPRGCPACWREKQEGEEGEAAIMRELARASRGIPSVEVLDPTPAPESDRRITEADWPPPVTTPPRLPTPEPTRTEKLVAFAKMHWGAVGATGLFAIVAVLVYLITKPTFHERNDPPILVEEARPFPVTPGSTIDAAFAIFGTVPPSVNPDDRRLARYTFATGVHVDAYNSAIYAVTLTTIDRTWNGNRVGLAEQLARGRLALLGAVVEEQTRPASPFPVGSFLVFPDAGARSARTLRAEVRPPNGCYDILLTLSPRIIGEVTRGDETFVAVARRGGTPEWVVVQVRIASRAMPGPYGDGVECE